MNKTTKIILWLVLLAVLAFFPQIFGIYYTNVFITFAVFAVYAASLNLLLGFTGLLSFGHAIFFGAGGYATALALKHIEGIGLLPALGFGFFAALVFAAILAPLAVRLSGTAFCMLHLAFGQVMYVLALKLRDITGGEDGIGNFPIPEFLGFAMKGEPVNFYYFALIVLGLATLLMWYFTKTPFGQIQVGVRDNAKRIDYLGFKVPNSKAVIYIVSAAFAGVAGSVYGLFHNLVSADGSLNIHVSFAPIISVMVGGIGSFFGPILGAGVMQVVEEIVVKYTDRVELATGIILIVVIMFLPGGILGYANILKAKFFPKKAANSTITEEKLEKVS